MTDTSVSTNELDELIKAIETRDYSDIAYDQAARALRELKALRERYQFIKDHACASGAEFSIELFDLIHGNRDDWDAALEEAIAKMPPAKQSNVMKP